MTPDDSNPPLLADVAERYVKLVLAMGLHDASYVDAYYGPPAWRQEALDQQASLSGIKAATNETLALLADEHCLRAVNLRKQLQAVLAKAEMLQGMRLDFDTESARLYDAVSPHHSRAYYEALVAQIDTLLPGDGSVSDRVNAFRAQFVIPADKLRAVMDAAIRAGRERTLQYIALPVEEDFVLEFVSDKPWSGYNWYKGNYQSVIQINTDLPVYIDRAVDLGCHEAYPGHHVYNVLLERDLVRAKGWMEYCIYPLYSPQSLIAEGTANYGIELSFTDAERLDFEQRVLYPLAGLDPALAPRYTQLNHLLAKLSYADNDIARQYLEGSLTREEALEWLVNVRLYPAEKSAQRLQFYDAMGAYVINYNLGQDMAKAYVERQGTTRAEHWAAFRDLMSSPRVPSGLRD
ncbi:hypothetical protein [Janthinobacterium sp. AD80]|uniref:hypothetical protein n=1 Tax=Janthinobacterium sp. AD80 TaxID=1528773 RepID=UPI000CC97681|nr:hypothetical protein [Janthinobacterium sp. AD80]PMQ16660.1 hypothetical protein JaAD80_09795 [Janthinobacterium sp. AD80]